ncbi:MAG: hypothetical protein H6721_04230 [Sandaracinus sp.]|nr:hypothetical protein [Sandaracinus sp.]
MSPSLRVLLASLAVAFAGSTVRADDRPYVFLIDPDGPREQEVELVTALNVGASASGAIRFIDPTLGQQGVVQQLGVQAGLTPWVAMGAFGLLGLGYSEDNPVDATGGGYVSFTVARPGGVRARYRDDEVRPRDGGSFGVTLWGVREFEGTFALSGLLNGSWVAGRFSAATNVQLERRFASGADPLDVIVRLAANVDVLHRHDALRVGVEYVGQDLEDAIEGEEAEGGAVHLVALSATYVSADQRLSLGLAPGLVVAPTGLGFGGRFTASYRF